MSVTSDREPSAPAALEDRRAAAPAQAGGCAGWLGGDCVARAGALGPTVTIAFDC